MDKRTANILIGIAVSFFVCCLCIVVISLVGRNPTSATPAILPTTVPLETLIAGTLSALNIPTAVTNPTSLPATATPALTNILPPPTATLNPNLIMPGTYLINVDIQPGIYKGVAGTDLFSSCYWARLKDLSGNLDALLANDNSIGQFYIEVQASDFAFETSCELVPLASLPPTAAEFPQAIKAGMYIVGRDIQAGTYRGQAGADITSSCYWGRLSNVTGTLGAIIANDNAIGQFYVQVSPTDFALSTKCDLERVGD